MSEHGRAHPGGGLVGNRNLKPYVELGYVPHGPGAERHHFGDDQHGPVSNTLEYAFDDWNVAQLAKALGKQSDYEYFTKRANNWRNVFNPQTGYVQPRLPSGDWYDPGSLKNEDRSDAWSGTGFVEGNAWQYTWFVPHDVNALVDVMGKEEFNRRLNAGFEKSAETDFNAVGRPLCTLSGQSRQSAEYASRLPVQLLRQAVAHAEMGACHHGSVLREHSRRWLAWR